MMRFLLIFLVLRRGRRLASQTHISLDRCVGLGSWHFELPFNAAIHFNHIPIQQIDSLFDHLQISLSWHQAGTTFFVCLAPFQMFPHDHRSFESKLLTCLVPANLHTPALSHFLPTTYPTPIQIQRASIVFKIPSSNTAKLSSPILLPRTVSYDASSKPPRPSGPYRAMSEQKVGRRRRSSSLLYQEPPETLEHMSDQAALPNLNANWVNAKG